ncbi:MAG: tRNA uridine-5-carboxymethylaminomethyl(34) synthesis GTPase MnmE [Corallococcus sp.]|nr:tRNA uridine-5-carboxymethylaminomethyl(34) synthesis GTPase MnmE [Corallococcus sp.]
MNTTIVARSTAEGRSAIAVIRMSGDDAINIAKKIFEPFPPKANLLKVGTLHTAQFDEHAMCVYFNAPHSYTGEDTVEFHCHGGIAVCRAVIEQCIANGAIPAQNGEFSKRAFINGKQNLTNAEGIIEMIDAETASAAKAGANLLENKLGKKVVELQNSLLDAVASCEAALDYPEEDLELPTVSSSKAILDRIITEIDKLISTSTLGKFAKYGINVAIVGAPNVGKSSILNALLGTDRAIVSEIQGTTRDTLTESVNYKDIKFNFVDTAGIRETDDVVEKEGVKRAQRAADSADVVLHVTDNPLDRSVYPTIRPQIRIYNKSDLYDSSPCCVDSLIVSAKSGDVEIIKSALYEMFSAGDIENSDLLITNERHLSCLKKAKDELLSAKRACDGYTLDVVASAMKQAWETLGQITGSTANEEIIDRIYSKFCLGK